MQLSQMVIDIVAVVEVVFFLLPLCLFVLAFIVWMVAFVIRTDIYRLEYFQTLNDEQKDLIRCFNGHKDYVFFKLDGKGKIIRNNRQKSEVEEK